MTTMVQWSHVTRLLSRQVGSSATWTEGRLCVEVVQVRRKMFRGEPQATSSVQFVLVACFGW